MKTSLTQGGNGAGSSKDRKEGKVKKGILKKSQVAKLGQMTLAQKCKRAAESAETAEEAASNLKEMLSKQEHSRVWSKHNVALKGKSAKERKEFDKLRNGRERSTSCPVHDHELSAKIHAGSGKLAAVTHTQREGICFE